LVFEDDFDDEFEEDYVVKEDIEDKDVKEELLEEIPDTSKPKPSKERKVWIPGENDGDKEKLEYESNAYEMMHFMKVEWPCLSFDFLTDTLGFQRTKFPHTAYVVAGTQANKKQRNKLLVMKMHCLHRTKYDNAEDSSSDSEENEEKKEKQDKQDQTDDDPILEFKQVLLQPSTNRIRSMPQRPGIVCVQLDRKPYVRLWDLTKYVQALDAPPTTRLNNPDPLIEFSGHPSEGFAIAWSLTDIGRLITGDCQKYIYLWNYKEGIWNTDKVPFSAHTASVEDLQWHPTMPNVFASCSVDKTIKQWTQDYHIILPLHLLMLTMQTLMLSPGTKK